MVVSKENLSRLKLFFLFCFPKYQYAILLLLGEVTHLGPSVSICIRKV